MCVFATMFRKSSSLETGSHEVADAVTTESSALSIAQPQQRSRHIAGKIACAGFAFFLIKGLVWLGIAAVAAFSVL